MKNQHVETEYTEDGVRYKVRHDKGLLFATGTQWEGDAVCHLTYSDMSEMPVMEGLKTCILNKEVPEQFSPPYYLLVRTGVAGNFHYSRFHFFSRRCGAVRLIDGCVVVTGRFKISWVFRNRTERRGNPPFFLT